MPFDSLPNRLGGIPNIYQYQNLPVKQPYPTAQVIAAIAQPLLGALEKFSPEERAKSTLLDLELKDKTARYAYAINHPEAAYGGKTFDPLLNERRALIVAQTNKANADANKPPKPDANATFATDPDYSAIYNEAFGPKQTPEVTGIPSIFLPPQ